MEKLTINFHLWKPCNMKCKFCFATFEDEGSYINLKEQEAIKVIQQIGLSGKFDKITFAGGEPTLCKFLCNLIKEAKKYGLTTMMVTNGSLLTAEYLAKLEGSLDWITLSIDSINDFTNREIGRTNRSDTFDFAYYQKLMDRIRQYNFRLKINTVVNSKNCFEDMSEFIQYARPERWKILQAISIEGQNDLHFQEMYISNDKFDSYLQRHEHIQALTTIVAEDEDSIRGSYLMLDPQGRFFYDVNGKYHYSKSLKDTPFEEVFSTVHFDEDKYTERGARYDHAPKVEEMILCI